MGFFSNPLHSIASFVHNPTNALNIPSGPASWMQAGAKDVANAAIGTIIGGPVGGIAALTAGWNTANQRAPYSIGQAAKSAGMGALGGIANVAASDVMGAGGLFSSSSNMPSAFSWGSGVGGQGGLDALLNGAGTTGTGASMWDWSSLLRGAPLALQAYGMLQTNREAHQLAGYSGLPQYNTSLEQLMTNPASVTTTPEYNFLKSQGEQAIQREAARAGQTHSTNLDYNLAKYVEGLASTSYQQQLQDLMNLRGQGIGLMTNSMNLQNQGIGGLGSMLALSNLFR